MVKYLPKTDHKSFVHSHGHKKNNFPSHGHKNIIEAISLGHFIIIVVTHGHKNTPLKSMAIDKGYKASIPINNSAIYGH